MISAGALEGDRDSILEAVRSCTAHEIVDRVLLARVPWIFSGQTDEFLAWKRSLASSLDVDPNNVVVVGSAGLGLSLNPNNGLLRPFLQESDVDIAVVSSLHFDVAWRAIQRIGMGGPRVLSQAEREFERRHREHLVFHGAIATERYLTKFSFGKSWLDGLRRAQRHPVVEGHPIRVRLYRDFESLRRYHESGIRGIMAGARDELAHSTETDAGSNKPLTGDREEADWAPKAKHGPQIGESHGDK